MDEEQFLSPHYSSCLLHIIHCDLFIRFLFGNQTHPKCNNKSLSKSRMCLFWFLSNFFQIQKLFLVISMPEKLFPTLRNESNIYPTYKLHKTNLYSCNFRMKFSILDHCDNTPPLAPLFLHCHLTYAGMCRSANILIRHLTRP